MKSKKFIAANWKMNKTVSESEKFISDLTYNKKEFNCDVLICPPFLSLSAITRKCHAIGINVGAQNCHFESSGAFTGEISVPMLLDLGVDYVILGHSERRIYFNETDKIISKKVDKALKNHLKVILCVGESKNQRDSGNASQTVINQVKAVLDNVYIDNIKNIVIAYEPVWAIGTGETIVPADAGKMCADIRNFIASKCGGESAENFRILYGGSVNSKNSESFLSMPGIDGALIGGASLETEEFLKIINIAENYQI